MKQKTDPQFGDVDRRRRHLEPRRETPADVRILVAEKNVPDLPRVDQVGKVHQHPGKHPEPPRVDQQSLSLVDDQVLVRLHPLLFSALVLPQPQKRMARIFMKRFCRQSSCSF